MSHAASATAAAVLVDDQPGTRSGDAGEIVVRGLARDTCATWAVRDALT